MHEEIFEQNVQLVRENTTGTDLTAVIDLGLQRLIKYSKINRHPSAD